MFVNSRALTVQVDVDPGVGLAQIAGAGSVLQSHKLDTKFLYCTTSKPKH